MREVRPRTSRVRRRSVPRPLSTNDRDLNPPPPTSGEPTGSPHVARPPRKRASGASSLSSASLYGRPELRGDCRRRHAGRVSHTKPNTARAVSEVAPRGSVPACRRKLSPAYLRTRTRHGASEQARLDIVVKKTSAPSRRTPGKVHLQARQHRGGPGATSKTFRAVPGRA